MWGATVRRGDRGDGHPISIHAPRVGRDRFLDYRHKFIRRFQSTRPVWGATAVPAWWQLHTAISIHAPRAGCDAGRRGHLTSRASISIHAPRARCDNVRSVQGGWLPVFQSTHPVRGATLRGSVSSPARSGFQSTHPVRGATMDKAAAAGNNEFQSTRPVWGATMCTSRRRSSATISIHAPRVGRDNCICVDIRVSLHFNPRAPCGARPGRRTSCSTRKYFNPRAPCGARPRGEEPRTEIRGFQSTRPVWGATSVVVFSGVSMANFNPRAPCGARPAGKGQNIGITCISIHAPRVGRDGALAGVGDGKLFQSTRPVWGATCHFRHCVVSRIDFNPRAPCGARPKSLTGRVARSKFQSTRPVWGATARFVFRTCRQDISIHAPRVGRDVSIKFCALASPVFQSTRPVWGATSFFCHDGLRLKRFQSTRPVWGATEKPRIVVRITDISIHAPRVGRDTPGSRRTMPTCNFNPRAPCGARPCVREKLQTEHNFNPRAPCGARHGG